MILAERFEPTVNTLKIIDQTSSRLCLPLITICGKTDSVVDSMLAALAAAVTTLDDDNSVLTGITGVFTLDDTAYSLIADDMYLCCDLSLGNFDIPVAYEDHTRKLKMNNRSVRSSCESNEGPLPGLRNARSSPK